MVFDCLIHQGLGHRWFVRLIVTLTSVAAEIYKYVLMEGVSKIDRYARHKHHSLRIICIDMKNRSVKHFCRIGAVTACPRILSAPHIYRIRRSEANLIIYDNVYRSAR